MTRSVLGICDTCGRTIYIHARQRCAGCYTAWQRAEAARRPTPPSRARAYGERRDATERARQACWSAPPDPTPDTRSVAEVVGPEIYALAAAEARRLAGRKGRNDLVGQEEAPARAI